MKSDTNLTSPVPSGQFGQPFTYDPQFKGPVKSRSCTDVICLFLFISFIAGWVVVAVFAFQTGNPKILLYPTDSEGNICGIDHYKSKPFLYFFDLTKCAKVSSILKGCRTPEVCVSECPTETMYITENSPESVKSKLICKPRTDMSKSVADLIKNEDCAALYLKSKPFRIPKVIKNWEYYPKIKDPLVGRCIPDHLLTIGEHVVDSKNQTIEAVGGQKLSEETVMKATKYLAKFLNAKEMGQKIFSDLETAWKFIALGLVFSMVLSFVWVVLMRWIAAPMVWLSIVLVLLLSGYGLYYSANMYVTLNKLHGSSEERQFTTHLSSYRDNKKTWLAFAIICGVVFLFLLLILLFLRKRILIAIALIKEGSKAVGTMFTTLFFPIFPYLLQLCVFLFWGAVALFLASSGKATFHVQDANKEDPHLKNNAMCDPSNFNASTGQCIFSNYGQAGNLYQAQMFNLFGFLWAIFFIVGVGQVSLAGAFAAYYWTLNKSDVPKCAIGVGVYRCVRFHLGSVAFGSLLIATVRFIRIMLEYIDQKCKKYENPVTKAILCCMKCCFWMLEKFLKFISKNAYIMMAVYGKNFCVSAKTAFELLFRNMIRVVVIDKVTDFLLLIGKLVIVGTAAVGSFFVSSGRIDYLNPYVPSLNYNLLPVFVITFGAYIIASLFFNVYGMAVDTLFLCFLEDCERNDGSPEKPYYMSKDLMKILDKKNKYRDPAV